MSTPRALALAPEHRLRRWKQAVSALPLMDAISAPLAAAPPLWASLGNHPVRPAVILTKSDIVPIECEPRVGYRAPVRLGTENVASFVGALYSRRGGAETEVVVMGPEPEALVDIQPRVHVKTDITTLANPQGWETPKKIEASWAIADTWRQEMSAALKAYLREAHLPGLPGTCLGCACRDCDDAAFITRLVEKGVDGICREFDLPLEGVRRALKRHKEILLARLELACSGWAVAYVLHCAAKLVSGTEMTALRTLEEVGVENARKYLVWAGAAATPDAALRERIVRKMIALVGPDTEEEVRGEFPLPAHPPAVRVAETREAWKAPAPEQPPVAGTPAEPHMTLKERVLAAARELDGVSAGFIARCFRRGTTDPMAILEAFTRPPSFSPPQTGRHRQVRRAGAGRGGARQPPHTTLFGDAAMRAIAAEGLEAGHVALAVSRVFGYPHKLRYVREDDAKGELTRRLNGIRAPDKAADEVLRFLRSAGIIRIKPGFGPKDGGMITIAAGAENPVGRDILAGVREQAGG